MKKPKQIEGGPGSCLHIVKNPIIVQSRAQSDGTKSPKASYTFREVNFVSEDLDALFVLQNKHQDISLTFRDCHFLSRGYVGRTNKEGWSAEHVPSGREPPRSIEDRDLQPVQAVPGLVGT